MRAATEYRPGRWALLDAGAVVGTTADQAEAAAWAARDEDLDALPLFAGLAHEAPDGPKAEHSWDLNAAAQKLNATASLDPSPSTRESQPAREDESHTGPAYLWLEGPAGADVTTWWASALAIFRRRSGRAECWPAETRARPDVLATLRPAAPAAVRLVESHTVLRGTVWLGPLVREATP